MAQTRFVIDGGCKKKVAPVEIYMHEIPINTLFTYKDAGRRRLCLKVFNEVFYFDTCTYSNFGDTYYAGYKVVPEATIFYDEKA